jgi:hypothetical protein
MFKIFKNLFKRTRVKTIEEFGELIISGECREVVVENRLDVSTVIDAVTCYLRVEGVLTFFIKIKEKQIYFSKKYSIEPGSKNNDYSNDDTKVFIFGKVKNLVDAEIENLKNMFPDRNLEFVFA